MQFKLQIDLCCFTVQLGTWTKNELFVTFHASTNYIRKAEKQHNSPKTMCVLHVAVTTIP